MPLLQTIMQRLGYVKRDAAIRAVRTYAAAKMNRLTSNWTTTNLSADAELRFGQLKTLRARSRELAANNDYVKRFLTLCKTNIIGPAGIILQNQARTPNGIEVDSAANTIIEDAWRAWGRRGTCDVTGKLSWLSAQNLFIRALARDGEAVVRIVRGYDNPFAFALQFIAADNLDEDYSLEEQRDGTTIRMSVEMDAWDRPTAYHVLTRHPGDYLYGSSTTQQRRERIPATDIVHAFLTDDARQSRGVPWMHSAMTRLNNVGAYEEAEIIAARVSASKMGVIETPSGEDYQGDAKDDAGNLLQDVEPGLIMQLPRGSTFKDFDPTHPAGNFAPFMKASLRGIAVGLGVNYNSLASDLEGVNYSSIRQGTIEDRDLWRMLQAFVAESFHDAVYSEWLRMAMLTGAVKIAPTQFERVCRPKWLARGWDWVDPLNDINAALKAVDNGLKTRRMIAAEQGLDLEDIVRDLAAEDELFKKYGVALPSNNGTTAQRQWTKPTGPSHKEPATHNRPLEAVRRW
jgi:lambda family phage portal protein